MTGSAATLGAGADEVVLWDVVEEHLDEAEFEVVQLGNALEHPALGLDDLGQWQERWAAHVDGLVVAGPVVIQRLVVPALEEAQTPERVTACVLALLESGELSPLQSVLGHPEEELRRAAAWACALAPAGERVAQQAGERLHAATSGYEQAGLLDVLAARGLAAPGLLEILEGNDPVTLPAALRAAPFCQEPGLARAIERHLDSSKPAVAEAAIFAALTHQSAQALDALVGQVSAGKAASSASLALLAALGGPAQHALIAQLAGSEAQARAALFALGYSGNLEHVPLLLERLRGTDETLVKLAAQALSLLFGLDLTNDRFQLPPGPPQDGGQLPPAAADPEAIQALPPFEDDDLDELPLPEPEDGLPALDVEAIASEVAQLSAGLQPGKRHLAGQPYTRARLLDMLARAPLRTRHALARMLCVDTAGQCQVDTRASVQRQRQQLQLASQQLSIARHRYPIW